MATPAIPGGDWQLTGGAGGSAGPSNAGSSSGFDNSGWNVNFGSGSIAASDAGDLGKYLPYALIAAAVLIAYRFSKK